MKMRTIRIISWGGLGDAVLLTPTLKALKEKYPGRKTEILCLERHKPIFLNNPHIDSLIDTSFRRHPFHWVMRQIGLMQYNTPDYSRTNPSISYSKGIIEVIAEIFGVTLVDKKVQLFLTDSELASGQEIISAYERPVTFNPYAVCSKNKEWDTSKWEELIRTTSEYQFLQLGLRKEPLIKGAVDLRGLPVRRSMAVIRYSLFYAGVDSFLNHVATAMNTPAIILFGASSPEVFGHDQNINIVKRSWCAPCIDLIAKSACPYGRECMNRITVRDVRAAIRKLEERNNVIDNLSAAIDETF